MREQTRWRLMVAAVFLLPMTAVKATDLYLNRSTPQRAAAVAPAASSAIDPALARALAESAGEVAPLSDDEQQLVLYMEHLRTRLLGRSPFVAHLPGRPLVQQDEPQRDTGPIVTPLNLTVQAIMGSDRGNIVLIAGQTYDVGEFVNDEWTVREIDPASRTVTFEHTASGVTESQTVLKQ